MTGRRSQDNRRCGLRAVAVLVVLVALTSSCGADGEVQSDPPSGGQAASTSPGTASTGSPDSVEDVGADADIVSVPPKQWAAMVATGMVREGCPITQASDLRRVDINYVNFDKQVERGYLIVHRDTAASIARIFTALFDRGFPIASMKGVENYDGDTNRSLAANNTSAYNCRRLDQINAPPLESPHANGRAVDINPLQNPWMDLRCDCWMPSARYNSRDPGPGKVLANGQVVRLFEAEGWIWQNIDVADYMHFDTGYPSAPYERPTA